MKIIVCLEENNGISFNGRRLSADRMLCHRIQQITKDSKLWLHPRSQQLFDLTCAHICVDTDYCSKAQIGEYVFFENSEVNMFASSAEEILVFRWNRRYPFDMQFSQVYLQGRELVFQEDFPGNSHEKITTEVYR